MNDYQKQAQDFLDQTRTVVMVAYDRKGRYFPDDTESRDIYNITLARGERSYTFRFGQSIAHTKGNGDTQEPTAYDVLACLTKYDPGDFENFCAELGYDEDSRTAEAVHRAVKAEFAELCRLYSDAELELMAEIQ